MAQQDLNAVELTNELKNLLLSRNPVKTRKYSLVTLNEFCLKLETFLLGIAWLVENLICQNLILTKTNSW